MTAVRASTNGAAARLIKAKRHEIAIRYRNGKKRVSMAALRCVEFERIFDHQYRGAILPDDDSGRIDIRIMVHTLGHRSDPLQRIQAWLARRAPWFDGEDRDRLIQAALDKPLRWRADTLARMLGLTTTLRDILKVRTIGAVDSTPAEREAVRKARKRQAKREQRRKHGLKPRTEYEQQSISRTKPWIVEGISRRTWYRRQRQAK